jgi:GDP-L-fucose synthase
MIDLSYARVLVTGGESMVGKAICDALRKRHADVFDCPHQHYNLLSSDSVNLLFDRYHPDFVIHAAGWNGGIAWNKRYPETIFYRTAMMGLNVLKACIDYQVEKVVSIISSCAYPEGLRAGSEIIKREVLFESDLWDGLPNTTVECHGLAKRMLDAYSRQIVKQHKIKAVCCVLTNCYGSHDSFHPDKTKVVGALIRKFVEAHIKHELTVTCWGTGSPLREFMYAPDAGEAIVQALERYENTNNPINIGSGEEVSIKTLTDIIAQQVGYQGDIIWDTTKPDGQMKKLLGTIPMMQQLDVPITKLESGIKETINWYIANKEQADAKGL